MKINSQFVYLFVGAVLIILLVQHLENQKLQRQIDKHANEKVEQNNDQFEELEEQEQEAESSQKANLEEIQELEEAKKQPHGKKDFTDNKSVTNAERYFSRRYGKD